VIRASGAEELLSNVMLDEKLIAEAAESAGRHCCPIDDVRGSAWYRRQLVEALLKRALSGWLE
jgi:CO/xanthine dehydrogenase FAD-binding subunit